MNGHEISVIQKISQNCFCGSFDGLSRLIFSYSFPGPSSLKLHTEGKVGAAQVDAAIWLSGSDKETMLDCMCDDSTTNAEAKQEQKLTAVVVPVPYLAAWETVMKRIPPSNRFDKPTSGWSSPVIRNEVVEYCGGVVSLHLWIVPVHGPDGNVESLMSCDEFGIVYVTDFSGRSMLLPGPIERYGHGMSTPLRAMRVQGLDVSGEVVFLLMHMCDPPTESLPYSVFTLWDEMISSRPKGYKDGYRHSQISTEKCVCMFRRQIITNEYVFEFDTFCERVGVCKYSLDKRTKTLDFSPVPNVPPEFLAALTRCTKNRGEPRAVGSTLYIPGQGATQCMESWDVSSSESCMSPCRFLFLCLENFSYTCFISCLHPPPNQMTSTRRSISYEQRLNIYPKARLLNGDEMGAFVAISTYCFRGTLHPLSKMVFGYYWGDPSSLELHHEGEVGATQYDAAAWRAGTDRDLLSLLRNEVTTFPDGTFEPCNADVEEHQSNVTEVVPIPHRAAWEKIMKCIPRNRHCREVHKDHDDYDICWRQAPVEFLNGVVTSLLWIVPVHGLDGSVESLMSCDTHSRAHVTEFSGRTILLPGPIQIESRRTPVRAMRVEGSDLPGEVVFLLIHPFLFVDLGIRDSVAYHVYNAIDIIYSVFTVWDQVISPRPDGYEDKYHRGITLTEGLLFPPVDRSNWKPDRAPKYYRYQIFTNQFFFDADSLRAHGRVLVFKYSFDKRNKTLDFDRVPNVPREFSRALRQCAKNHRQPRPAGSTLYIPVDEGVNSMESWDVSNVEDRFGSLLGTHSFIQDKVVYSNYHHGDWKDMAPLCEIGDGRIICLTREVMVVLGPTSQQGKRPPPPPPPPPPPNPPRRGEDESDGEVAKEAEVEAAATNAKDEDEAEKSLVEADDDEEEEEQEEEQEEEEEEEYLSDVDGGEPRPAKKRRVC